MTQSSYIRNAIKIDTGFVLDGTTFAANSTYSITFSQAGESMTLVPITITQNGDGSLTSALDSGGTIINGIDPVDFAAKSSNISAQDTGYIGANVLYVSGLSSFTSSAGGNPIEIGAGNWAVLPSSSRRA